MTRKLSIAIATSGRFHVLDLARELRALGHRVLLYSYVPRDRAERFGLPRECHVGLLPYMAPLVAWQKFAPDLAPARREALSYKALNRALERVLQPCEVLIAMSGMYLEALEFSRVRFGARTVLVRSSKHILTQDEILAKVPGALRPSPLTIKRELAGYERADMIDVPSAHTVASFERAPHLSDKLVANPLGVDLAMFPEHPVPAVREEGIVDMLFVGTWSLVKGCDLLIDAVAQVPGIRLRHVGPMGDAPRAPVGSAIAHLGQTDQKSLSAHYAVAQCLVLPSREDGFGMVLTQALASGLWVLGSTQTGAPDLKERPGLSERVDLIEAGNLTALVEGLTRMRDRIRRAGPPPPLNPAVRDGLGWAAYAKRYEQNLFALLDTPRKQAA